MSMASGSSLPDGWKMKIITAPVSYVNAAQVREWLLGEMQGDYGIVAKQRDWNSPPSVNNTFCWAALMKNADVNGAVRYRGGAYVNLGNWSASYDCVVEQGDKFAMLWFEEENV